MLYQNHNFYEIAVIGEDYRTMGSELAQTYVPQSILVGSQSQGNLELLKNREVPGKTLIYVCIEGACKLPVDSAGKALEQL